MNKFDPYAALAHFVGNLPTLIAVLLSWRHSNRRFRGLTARYSGLNGRFDDFNARLSSEFAGVNRRIDDTRDLLCWDFRRVEKVMDARLRRLEDRER